MAEKSSKKGLGTGLGALFGEDLPELPKEQEQKVILELPIAKVEPRQEQPRYTFDEVALAELSESIREYGMIQPITVRPLESGYYQIIAGERRWRAARMAGLTEVPVRVLEADDRRVSEMALVENLQREDLNPIEEAKGLRALMEEYGMTQEEAAQSVGKSRSAVANALRLLNLCPYVMELLEQGFISTGHAKSLLSIQSSQTQEAAANTIVAQGLSVRQTERLCAKLIKEPPQQEKPDPQKITVDYAAETEKDLQTALGRRVKIVEGRKKGKIELEYYDADDREALISALKRVGKA
ncbi:MAG: ParB/RepB/Spo0J family partition protein [Candidatus Heteroscillospira sp.]|jgi:ParB family chromosome partitioning protein